MSLTLTIVVAVVGGLVVALAAALVRFNLKRFRIARIAAAASDDELERIYRLVEEAVVDKSCGCVLGRTNRAASDKRSIIGLTNGLQGFPWSGRSVEITTSSEVTFQFAGDAAMETRLGGKVFRPVRVPRVATSSRRVRNVYSPRRYVSSNVALRAALQELCPDSPGALLSYLLCVGRDSYEFEPIDQVRIGGTPAWVQAAEWPTCEQCNQRLRLIVQIPGVLLSATETVGTFYWFGCKQHTESTKVIGQFT